MSDLLQPEHIAVGRIVSAHGVRGAVRVQLLSDFPTAFRRRKMLLVGEELRPTAVLSASIGGAMAIVRLAGVENPERAAAMRGELLYIPAGDAATPKKGQYFWHQVVGLRVVTEDGRELGRVQEILRTGANDVYVVQGSLGELLIPAIEDVVQAIEPEVGQILIRSMPGLLPGED